MKHIEGQSFIARLYCETPGLEGGLAFTSSAEPGQSGWLLRRDDSRGTVELRFDYLEHTADRVHYRIAGAPGGDYSGARVGISHRGYLGFYRVAAVSDFWKVQMLDYRPDENAFSFIWRDHHGQRVSITREGLELRPPYPSAKPMLAQYLCVNRTGGQALQFRAQIIDYV